MQADSSAGGVVDERVTHRRFEVADCLVKTDRTGIARTRSSASPDFEGGFFKHKIQRNDAYPTKGFGATAIYGENQFW
jgi:hypothetical protein